MKPSIRQFYFWMLSSGRSPGTAKRYRDVLESFESKNPGIALREVFPQILQSFVSEKSSLSAGSRNNLKACLRSFFSWAVENDFLQKNPARLIQFEKAPVREAPHLSGNQIRKLLKATESNARDHLLFSLYCLTGCRLSEIQGLNIGDIRGKKSLEIIGKGRKKRMIPLNSDLQKIIRESVNGDPASDPLFISRRGERLSTSQIQNLLRDYLGKAGIKGDFSIHSLRHSFITEVFRRTKNIRIAQELAGHSSIQTTVRYTHLGREEIKEAVRGLYS